MVFFEEEGPHDTLVRVSPHGAEDRRHLPNLIFLDLYNNCIEELSQDLEQ